MYSRILGDDIMVKSRLALAGLIIAAGLGVSACATDGYGYGGGYGYYGDYYNGGYYDDGGLYYGPSYYGWYGDYYYPGAGVYVYDRNHRRHRRIVTVGFAQLNRETFCEVTRSDARRVETLDDVEDFLGPPWRRPNPGGDLLDRIAEISSVVDGVDNRVADHPIDWV